MAACTLGAEIDLVNPPFPRDGSDFAKCYRLIELIPEVATSFPKIASLSKPWRLIIENWSNLASAYEDDLENETNHFYPYLWDILNESTDIRNR